MRYIGNKTKLLDFIYETISEHTDIYSISKFYDLFAGTGAVSNHMRIKYNIVANDILKSSYFVNKGLLQNKPILPENIFNILNNLQEEGFIYNNYSETGSNRLYFSEENGKKIDGIRNYLFSEKKNKNLSMEQFEYLMYCFIYAIHKVSNTTGVYGAYLKKLNGVAKNRLVLEELDIIETDKTIEVYNKNCIDLLEKIEENDIVYIDPPYNSRQYNSNYHLLETIVSDVDPKIKIVRGEESVSGLPDNIEDSKSAWCSKGLIEKEIEKIGNCKSKYVFMSYNNEGLISIEKIGEIFGKYGKVIIKKMDHKKYKSNINSNKSTVEEVIICRLK
ncbi:MAG: modification methylase [Flavobacteriales bacterium]|nr:modification methylase [Flavobacteriales bacterium]|tara:strand:+ start:2469 stop:3464 length:996 start_codon:yes stop_codon:yes gene_type:complete